MDIVAAFALIAAIIFLGYITEVFFKKTKIPDALFLIGAGIVLGSVLEWISPSSFGAGAEIFTTFALVFLLFHGALSIDFRNLVRSLPLTFRVTLFSFFFTVPVVTIIGMIFGLPFLVALLVGMILGGTSSSVIIPFVNIIKIKREYGLLLTLESAISDVLCIVGAITIMQIYQTGEVIASGIFKTLLSSFALAIIVGCFVGVVWLVLLAYSSSLAKSHMLTIAVVVGLYAFVQSPFVEASGAIAALSFGLMLGNSKSILRMQRKKKNREWEEDGVVIKSVLSSHAKNFYGEISFFVKTFFFVFLGIMMDFSDLTVFLYGFIIVIALFLTRSLVIKLMFRKRKIEPRDRAFLEALIPKGLAAAVLTQLAMQYNIPHAQQVGSIVLAVIFISIFCSSVLVFLAERNMFTGFLSMFSSQKE